MRSFTLPPDVASRKTSNSEQPSPYCPSKWTGFLPVTRLTHAGSTPAVGLNRSGHGIKEEPQQPTPPGPQLIQQITVPGGQNVLTSSSAYSNSALYLVAHPADHGIWMANVLASSSTYSHSTLYLVAHPADHGIWMANVLASSSTYSNSTLYLAAHPVGRGTWMANVLASSSTYSNSALYLVAHPTGPGI